MTFSWQHIPSQVSFEKKTIKIIVSLVENYMCFDEKEDKGHELQTISQKKVKVLLPPAVQNIKQLYTWGFKWPDQVKSKHQRGEGTI